MDGQEHSSTELHPSEYISKDDPIQAYNGQNESKDAREQDLIPRAHTSSNREISEAVSAIPNTPYRNEESQNGDEEEIKRNTGGDDSIDGK